MALTAGLRSLLADVKGRRVRDNAFRVSVRTNSGDTLTWFADRVQLALLPRLCKQRGARAGLADAGRLEAGRAQLSP